jgi:hypothetical protein
MIVFQNLNDTDEICLSVPRPFQWHGTDEMSVSLYADFSARSLMVNSILRSMMNAPGSMNSR